MQFGSALAQAPMQEKKLQGIGFRFPQGLELELVAAPPMVQWPVVAEWSSEGDLMVVESAGVAGNVEEQSKTRPHRMVRLIDDNKDGVFDRRVVAATDLGLPQGVLCIGNQVLVSTPPQILSLVDEDGDGIFEKRDVWFDGKTLTYCANDLHGPYLGRDGWIYWCKGAFAEQNHELLNGKSLKTNAAHIFRRRLEGGKIEPVMTGGMDNPVEVAITSEGERFFTSTFLQHPGGGKRDGIAHAVYGGVYGKDHHVINGHPRTGPLMPIMTHLGPAAPSGLTALRSSDLVLDSQLFEAKGATLASAQFNLQRVALHRLVENGATYSTVDQDLLVGDRIDFHPTDILEDADGSLIVVDTGGWYDLCCPSSGVDQELAKGGIYRLKGKRSGAVEDPRGAEFARVRVGIDGLAARLNDPRWWVRRDAMNTLVANGDRALEALKKLLASQDLLEETSQEVAWTLCRIEGDASEKILRDLLKHANPKVRQTAIHALSVRRAKVSDELRKILTQDASIQVRRAAAEGLGRVGDEASIPGLLAALDFAPEDRVFEHSVLYALMEIDKPKAIADSLKQATKSRQQLACVKVLDQLHPELLTSEPVMSLVGSEEESIRRPAIEILARHPEWVESVAPLFAKRIVSLDDHSSDRSLWLEVTSGWADQPAIRNLILKQLQEPTFEKRSSFLLPFIKGLRDKELAKEVSLPLAKRLSKMELAEQEEWLRWLASIKINPESHRELMASLIRLANESKSDPSRQFIVLSALPVGTKLDPAQFSETGNKLIETVLSADENLQPLAVAAIARIQLSPKDGMALLEKISEASPLQLPAWIGAISRASDDALDTALLERLPSIPTARTLGEGTLNQLYSGRSSVLQEQAKKTASILAQPPREITEKLNKLEQELPTGDAVRGFQVFRSPKAACSACHQIGYVGGNVGPELSKIGATRTRRDLLEAILFPSVRLAQSYQAQRVVTEDGQIYNGLVRNETAREFELFLAVDKTVRIDKSDITERKPSSVSIMPAGLDQSLTPQELADLIAMLEARR